MGLLRKKMEYDLIVKKDSLTAPHSLIKNLITKTSRNKSLYKSRHFAIENYNEEQLVELADHYSPCDEQILAQLFIANRFPKPKPTLAKKHKNTEINIDSSNGNFDLPTYLIYEYFYSQSIAQKLSIDQLILSCRNVNTSTNPNNYPWKYLGFLFLTRFNETFDNIQNNNTYIDEIRYNEDREAANSNNPPLTSQLLIQKARESKETSHINLMVKVADTKSLTKILNSSGLKIFWGSVISFFTVAPSPLSERMSRENISDIVVRIIQPKSNLNLNAQDERLLKALLIERSFYKEHWREISEEQYKQLGSRFNNSPAIKKLLGKRYRSLFNKKLKILTAQSSITNSNSSSVIYTQHTEQLSTVPVTSLSTSTSNVNNSSPTTGYLGDSIPKQDSSSTLAPKDLLGSPYTPKNEEAPSSLTSQSPPPLSPSFENINRGINQSSTTSNILDTSAPFYSSSPQTTDYRDQSTHPLINTSTFPNNLGVFSPSLLSFEIAPDIELNTDEDFSAEKETSQSNKKSSDSPAHTTILPTIEHDNDSAIPVIEKATPTILEQGKPPATEKSCSSSVNDSNFALSLSLVPEESPFVSETNISHPQYKTITPPSSPSFSSKPISTSTPTSKKELTSHSLLSLPFSPIKPSNNVNEGNSLMLEDSSINFSDGDHGEHTVEVSDIHSSDLMIKDFEKNPEPVTKADFEQPIPLGRAKILQYLLENYNYSATKIKEFKPEERKTLLNKYREEHKHASNDIGWPAVKNILQINDFEERVLIEERDKLNDNYSKLVNRWAKTDADLYKKTNHFGLEEDDSLESVDTTIDTSDLGQSKKLESSLFTLKDESNLDIFLSHTIGEETLASGSHSSGNITLSHTQDGKTLATHNDNSNNITLSLTQGGGTTLASGSHNSNNITLSHTLGGKTLATHKPDSGNITLSHTLGGETLIDENDTKYENGIHQNTSFIMLEEVEEPSQDHLSFNTEENFELNCLKYYTAKFKADINNRRGDYFSFFPRRIPKQANSLEALTVFPKGKLPQNQNITFNEFKQWCRQFKNMDNFDTRLEELQKLGKTSTMPELQ